MPDRLGDPLFAPLRLGALVLPNRVVMAPMTRCRAMADGRATPLMARHYAERAGAGLIIAEGAWISPEGVGQANTPGVFRASHVAAWREVTMAVHAAGGRIALQLWHAGRISHPLVQPGGSSPVAPTALAAAGEIHTPAGKRPFPVPRPLLANELPRIAADFADAAERAREAGFDAVEIQAANGYLLDQFLRSSTNLRQDTYGGSPENRSRLTVQVAEVVAARIGAERTGIRISPWNAYNDIRDEAPPETFLTLAHLLRPIGLAWLHLIEPVQIPAHTMRLAPELRAAFGGPVILAGGQSRDSAEQALSSSGADALAFGRPFIANPDLPSRLRVGAPLAEPDPRTIYQGAAEGYVGWPTWSEAPAA